MFSNMKANILFNQLLKRHDIEKAYAMVPPEDSWYDTITTVHHALAEIQKLPHEVLEITSFDGLKLKGIYYPGTGDKTMIWIHGYTSHAERESAFPGLFYHSLGFNVLIPYQRAHGISEGKYLTFGALEQRDMLQWVDAVNDRIPDGSIVIHGLSMGGGIALELADIAIKNVKCIVSDAPSNSIEEFLKNISTSVFKKDGQKVFSLMMARFRKEFGVDASDFCCVRSVKNSRYPIFLTAGSNENMEEFLHELEQENPRDTQVLILPGCNHGNGMYKQTELYQSALKNFILKYTVDACLNTL